MIAGARSAGSRATVLRHLAGFAVAPLVVPLVFGAIELARSARTWVLEEALLSALHDAARTSLPLGYAAAILLGAPIVLALAVARRLTVPWVVGVSSAVAAIGVAAAIFVADDLDGERPLAFEDLPFVALVAAGGAALAAAVSGAYCGVARVPLRRALAGSSPPGGV